MKIQILRDPGYGWDDNIEYPITVEGERFKNIGFDVKITTLSNIGFNMNISDFTDGYTFFYPDDCVAGFEPTEPTCVRDMCCNQFGERDEIQAIIDKLRADVAERDERIESLEQALQQTVDERNGAWFEVEELNTRLNRLREYE